MAKKKKIIIWIIIIIVIGAGLKMFLGKEPKIEYITEKVEKGAIVQTVSVTGELLSVERAELDFEISGRVKSVSVKVGDEIKKGQEIARLDDKILRFQFIQTQRDRDIQQENLDLARRNWDDLKPEEKEAKKLTVRKAQAAVEASGAQLAKTVLYSSIDGIVAKIGVEEGENVTAGSALLGSSTPVATIIKGEEFEIEVEVPESDITKVILNQAAGVTFDALPSDEEFSAKVIEVEPTSTVIQDVVYYGVKLEIGNFDERFKDGMSADVDIHTAEKESVLMIPQRAIRNGDGNKRVQILLGSGETEEVEVKTGLRGDNGMIEIISGLTEGQEIVTFVSEK